MLKWPFFYDIIICCFINTVDNIIINENVIIGIFLLIFMFLHCEKAALAPRLYHIQAENQ